MRPRVEKRSVLGWNKFSREYLVLEDLFPPLGPYPLKDWVGMIVPCVTLRMLLSKGRYAGHLQRDSMRKGPKSWANLYGSGLLGAVDNIYARDGKHLTETACPTRGPWLKKITRGSKLRMGGIKKQDFGVNSDTIKDLLQGWYT